MIADIVVFAAAACAAAFTVFWMAIPNLRNWIERPKYRFLANVQSYERSGAMRDQSK